MKYFLVFSLILSLFSCSEDDSQIEWEEVICHDIAIGDDIMLKTNINNYLESIVPYETNNLILDFTGWLNELECTNATLFCEYCLNTDPPSSIIDLNYVQQGDSLNKKLIVISFELANSMRLTEIQ